MNSYTYFLIACLGFLAIFPAFGRFFNKPRAENFYHFKFKPRKPWFALLTLPMLFTNTLYRDYNSINLILALMIICLLIYYIIKAPFPGKVSLSAAGYQSHNKGKVKLEDITRFQVERLEVIIHAKGYPNHDRLRFKDLIEAQAEDLILAFEDYANRYDHIEFEDLTKP